MRSLTGGVVFVSAVLFGVQVARAEEKPAKAEEKPDAAMEALLEASLDQLLDTPVTSASLKAQKTSEAPSVINVVTRDQIEAYGWENLNEILYRQPGFAPSMDFNHRTVSSRGFFESFANNHLLHLVDGIPMNDPLYGTAWTWPVTPNVFMAKTVEVLRGPGSALYGSNATDGVVHVKTISAHDLPAGVEAGVRVGQRDTKQVYVLAGNKSRLFETTLGFTALTDAGNSYLSYDGSLTTDSGGKLVKFPTWDQQLGQYLWAKVEGAAELKGLTFQYHFNHFNWEFGQGNINLRNNLKENLDESRHLIAVTYQGSLGENIQHNSTITYQIRPYAWFTQEAPNGITLYGTDNNNNPVPYNYPGGIWESVDTTVRNWFARTQWTLTLPAEATVLVGADLNGFHYNGDRAHFANVDLTPNSTPVFPTPFAGGGFQSVGPFMQWILNHPITNGALYLQLTSGTLLGKMLQATLGVRGDYMWYTFNDLSQADPNATGSKNYSNLSPRLALVFLPSDTVSLKLLLGTAFRAPAPIELGVAHTYYTASNLLQLKPEVIYTGELAFEWSINKSVHWKSNFYLTQFKDEIGYDAFSVYRNLFTLTNAGFEAEVNAAWGPVQGFLNYSFSKRLDESIPSDSGIALSKDSLTWYPDHGFNAGANGTWGNFSASLSGRLQGTVNRRSSEVGSQTVPYFAAPTNLDLYRPQSLAAWVQIDAKVAYAVTKTLSVALVGKNIFDTDGFLVKTFAFPYDFKTDGRVVYGRLEVKL